MARGENGGELVSVSLPFSRLPAGTAPMAHLNINASIDIMWTRTIDGHDVVSIGRG